ncbi:transposase [Mycoplasmopsis hyopharyngis]|uniref:transposase n=1 Tax=Mycoplasmopsis hyopharyngis TaxID=29558 RepID=UPI003872B95F
MDNKNFWRLTIWWNLCLWNFKKWFKPEEIVAIYHKQWQIEENFRTLKNSLKIRLIFVWKAEHIRGHFALYFLAL